MFTPRRSRGRIQPRAEGVWGPVLATFLFLAFLFFFAWMGVGVWRFVKESRDRSDKLDDLRTLTLEIEDEISLVLNLTIDTNCTVVIENATQPNRYPDDEFLVFDGSNPTAQVGFNASNINALSTVILTSQNVSGIVAHLADIVASSSTFQDDTFAVINDADNTKEMNLDLSSVSAGTTRTLSIQPVDGTIAYLADIPTFGSVFQDDEFAVVNFLDNSKRVMLNCSLISSGATRLMAIQDRDGVIAYLSDLVNATGPPFSDLDFAIFAASDLSAKAKFDLALISPGTFVIPSIQDRSGTIAYLSDIPQIVEVVINQTRQFPNNTFEGVSTLSGLGDLTHLELTFCGGGGGTCESNDSGGAGGGGSGATIVDFFILDPNSKFTHFNITLGDGGGACTNLANRQGGTGGTTTVTGVSATGFFFDLDAFGGAGGGIAGFSPGGNFTLRSAGGGAGGSGGPGEGTMGGPAGSLGGVNGPRGMTPADSFPTCDPAFPIPNRFRFPWYSGQGGFQGEDSCPQADSGIQGGRAWRESGSSENAGTPGYFGLPNTATETVAGFCAGAFTTNLGTGDPEGGSGLAVVRYYVR